MPSNALGKFEGAMMKDVNRIIATHASIQNGGRGNKALGHLTRSGVLLLCAAWELYIEELMIETVRVCSQRAQSPSELPKAVQKTIAEHVKGSQHQLRVLALAGDGWRAVYAEMAVEWVSSLNTPNKHNINAGKPQSPSSCPNGRPFCRLSPNPTPPPQMCAENEGIRSEMAGGGRRRAYKKPATGAEEIADRRGHKKRRPEGRLSRMNCERSEAI